MSNITEALNQRAFLIPQADFTTESHKEIIKFIINKHGEREASEIVLIDENDDYDSFFVRIGDRAFCIKISFDSVAIFYEYMILKGIQNLNISPVIYDKGEVEFGKKIYYTIQSYDRSTNLKDIGASNILDEQHQDFNIALVSLHRYEIPDGVFDYLDNNQSYLEYHDINFNSILSYVDASEQVEYEFIKSIFQETYSEMMDLFIKNKEKIQQKQLVHGNLNLRTIIVNNYIYRFINLENAFTGSPFFDLCNLVFELQMSGIKEHDFITKKIDQYKLCENRLKAGKFLEEYKICKEIWTRKKFLDLIVRYLKEVIILNKSRVPKMAQLSSDFSNHFYRFDKIKAFNENRHILLDKFSELMVDY